MGLGGFLKGGVIGSLTGLGGLAGGVIGHKKQKSAQKKQSKYEMMQAQQNAAHQAARPGDPGYESLRDPKTGLLASQYNVKPQTLDTSTLAGYQAMKERALGTGPSKWADLMTKKQMAEEAGAKDAASRQAMSGAAQARSSLASRGGLSSGARERLAAGSGQGLLEARQGVGSQGIQSRLGILTDDEKQKMSLLSGFAEGEAKIAGSNIDATNRAQESNIERALQEKRAKEARDLDMYGMKMKEWGAEGVAQTTEQQGKKPGGK